MAPTATQINTLVNSRSNSPMTTVGISRAASFTYTLTRVVANSTPPPPPPPPTNTPVQDANTSLHHVNNHDISQLQQLPIITDSHPHSWTNQSHPHLPTSFDEANHHHSETETDTEDEDEDEWDLHLNTLGLCTVDSMELIRRNTEDWKSRRGSVASKTSNSSIVDEARKTVERLAASLRNGILGYVKRFSG